MNSTNSNLPSSSDLSYSIGIVTYVERFEKYFVPLVKKLVEIFPDKEIICVLNGHHDINLQLTYLKHGSAFLNQYPNVRYVTNETHQSLAKCWNWTMVISSSRSVLLLNDDLDVSPLFRLDFEENLRKNPDFFIMNSSWSHFLISKKVLKQVGWFEERLLGIGQEDADYATRMTLLGIVIPFCDARGVKNFVATHKNAGWIKMSGIADGKYSQINKEFIHKKWEFTEVKKDSLHPYGTEAKLKSGMETPIFYDFAILDNTENNSSNSNQKNVGQSFSFIQTLKLPIEAIYGSSRLFARKVLIKFREKRN
ncbi:MAG: glycosyltransferase [Candidatus Micrarchaeota archaeon]|nr:glycosyltransferase [Candidatus Micrarchaeota archaeon]